MRRRSSAFTNRLMLSDRKHSLPLAWMKMVGISSKVIKFCNSKKSGAEEHSADEGCEGLGKPQQAAGVIVSFFPRHL